MLRHVLSVSILVATAGALHASEPVRAVSGSIKFSGAAPEAAAVDLSPDPYCAEHHTDDTSAFVDPTAVRVGDDGGLADAFVQLTTGVPDEKYDAPEEPVVLDQVGCTYVPHVFGVMKKQDIEIRNSDATLHNVHPTPERNKEFNLAMPNKGDVRTKSFRKAEEAVQFKCDVHPWMTAYCFVMEHPYFATTDAEGNFSLPTEGLEDGDYGIKVWHSVLGTVEGKITIKDGAATLEMSFDA